MPKAKRKTTDLPLKEWPTKGRPMLNEAGTQVLAMNIAEAVDELAGEVRDEFDVARLWQRMGAWRDSVFSLIRLTLSEADALLWRSIGVFRITEPYGPGTECVSYAHAKTRAIWMIYIERLRKLIQERRL